MKKVIFFYFFCILLSHTYLYPQTFTNVASLVGINHSFTGQFNGAGITFCDFNMDGNDDILLPSDLGSKIAIFKNNSGIFQSVENQYNINQTNEDNSIIAADYDNDGDRDIFIMNFKGYVKLYRNNGTNFDDYSAAAGIPQDSGIYSSAILLDYNRDGYLDLYVGVYNGFTGFPNRTNLLLKNKGNGTFEDVTAASNAGNFGNKVLAMASLDYNNDNWPDIYIACDRRYGNIMMKNNGNGTFSNVSTQTNTGLEMDAMGIGVGDYDNNGYMDLYVSNGEEGNAFFKNNGNGTFTEVAASLNMSVNRICWGNNFIDYDNDGDLDLVISVSGGSPIRRKVAFTNNGNGTFTVNNNSGFESSDCQSYGCALGDYNNDGYVDVGIMNVYDNTELWKNNGGSNKWIKINLQGTYSNREGIGSLIAIYRNGTKFLRYVNCGSSYCSQNSLQQTYGVGTSSTIDSIVVKWPSGIKQTVRNVSSNQVITITEAGVIGINNNNNSIPSEYKLNQNYPNPFNPATIIEYSVPKSSSVTIKLFDILGNEIKTLVSGYKTAGSYKYTLTENVSSQLSTGVYYYRMTADDFSDTKKMILVK